MKILIEGTQIQRWPMLKTLIWYPSGDYSMKEIDKVTRALFDSEWCA